MLHCHLPHHMMNQMVSMVGPMAHSGNGVHAGMGMEEGMGMIREGHALSEKNGPSSGRALGVGSTFEERVTHLPVSLQGAAVSQPAAPDQHQHVHHGEPGEGKLVPGFPQDMKMVMDDMVSKPETHGLRPTWTMGMMGMMTLIRVLTPEKYDLPYRNSRRTGSPKKRSPKPTSTFTSEASNEGFDRKIDSGSSFPDFSCCCDWANGAPTASRTPRNFAD